jgi:predicted Ser/Thr protein kinase
METKRVCKECGAPVSSEAPEGLCPKCLMKVGLGTQPAGTANAGPSPGTTPAQPAQLAGYFPQLEILELLGQGGMGAVYKARQPGLDRLVALKILPPQAAGDAGFAERFNREARALARLNHPNIVAVFDFGQTHGLHYFIMEYVDGLNLRQLEQAGKLKAREALKIIPQICDALQFAHDEGIVHRDIKPENVLLDKKGRVKIADFGLARILGREPTALRLTGAKDVMGTPHYMAPEQFEHPQEVDHRADIYSLGVVFYEMLTGELPLGRFAPPSRKVQMDVRLDEVVLHALEREPELRYQRASQVKTDIETITGTPALAVEVQAAAAGTAPLSPGQDAWHQVRGPAIGLMVAGVLNWVLIPVTFLAGLVLFSHLGVDRGLSVATPVIPALAFISGSVIFVAGLKMKRLEAFWLAVLGSILAMVITPGNIVGLPIGIWSLVVLSRRDVRQVFGTGFRPPARSAAGAPEFWKTAVGVVSAVILVVFVLMAEMLILALALPALSRHKASLADQPAFVISGTVTDTAGKPIYRARVADNIYGADTRRTPQEAWTDTYGKYRLLTWYEEHTVAASAPGYKTKLNTLFTKPLGRESQAEMDFQLELANAPPSPE